MRSPTRSRGRTSTSCARTRRSLAAGRLPRPDGRGSGRFGFGDVVEAITRKMVRRHPHVSRLGSRAPCRRPKSFWEAEKAKEQAQAGSVPKGVLDGVPVALPALSRAVKLPGQGRPRRFRLAVQRRGADQDRRGARSCGTPRAPHRRSAHHRGIWRPALRHGQSRPPSRHRPGDRRGANAGSSGASAISRNSKPAAGPRRSPTSPRWTASGTTPRPRSGPDPCRPISLEVAGTLPAVAPLIGLDLGSRTIGIAVSDRLRKVASARTVLRRTRFQPDAGALLELATKEGAAGIVIGLPLNMDGSEGPRAQATRAFARNLEKLTPIPLIFGTKGCRRWPSSGC